MNKNSKSPVASQKGTEIAKIDSFDFAALLSNAKSHNGKTRYPYSEIHGLIQNGKLGPDSLNLSSFNRIYPIIAKMERDAYLEEKSNSELVAPIRHKIQDLMKLAKVPDTGRQQFIMDFIAYIATK